MTTDNTDVHIAALNALVRSGCHEFRLDNLLHGQNDSVLDTHTNDSAITCMHTCMIERMNGGEEWTVNVNYPLLSTALLAYSTWKMRPSGL